MWDTDSGLPDSSVTSIVQTPDGYLWVGTHNRGLVRFDGQRFVDFLPGNTPELKSYEIQKLLVDEAGTLWIANVEGGLISYRAGRFHYERESSQTPQSWLDKVLLVRPKEVLLSSIAGWIFRGENSGGTNRWQTLVPPGAGNISVPCRDRDGVIWYRSADLRLNQLRDGRYSKLTDSVGLRSPQVNAFIIDAAGNLWVGTAKELAMWDGKHFVDMTPTNGEPFLPVRNLAACPDGSIWVRTDEQLFKCRDRQGVAMATPWNRELRPQSSAGGMFADSRGDVWLMQDGEGIWHVGSDGRVTRISEKNGLPNNAIKCWFEDREQNLWVGLTGGGLARIRPRVFHSVWPAEGFHYAARTVCEDTDGTFWFGTFGNYFLREQAGKFEALTLPPNPASGGLGSELAVLPATNEMLWVGSVGNGLFTYSNGVLTRPFSSAAIREVARVLYQDRAGGLWIGSEFGLFLWRDGKLKNFWTNENFTAAYVLAITQDSTSDVWVGTAIGELRRYHNGKFESFRPKDSLTDNATVKAAAAADPMREIGRGTLSAGGEKFWALYADADGAIWIGTLGGGVLRFQNGQFTRFGPADGLPSENINQILEDDRHQLWLGTSAGVVCVSKAELNDFASGVKKTITFITYGKFDGLPAVECSGGSQPACWPDRAGRLWFTTVKGAVWVNPADLHRNLLPPSVKIEAVSVDGRRIVSNANAENPAATPPPEIKVDAGQHYFEFKFSALSFTSPDKVRFKWRLMGLEKNWVDGEGRRSVTYSFIPPGGYQFEVTACNNDGVWNEQPTVIKFTVLPYFWQRWWFRVVSGLSIVSVVILIYSIRIARLRDLERLRLRIARDLHDEVGANLGSISLLAQIMEQHPSAADAVQVRGIAVQTIDTLRDIIWFIDPTHDRLSDLVVRLQETAKLMLQNVECRFDQSGDFLATNLNLSLSFRRNVPALFKEALHNILKHSHATVVEISVRRLEKGFQVRIHDNGIGFDTSAKSSGNGLKNLRRRAAVLGGDLQIQSSPGSGTTITFTAPVTQTRDWWQGSNRRKVSFSNANFDQS